MQLKSENYKCNLGVKTIYARLKMKLYRLLEERGNLSLSHRVYETARSSRARTLGQSAGLC